MKSEEGVGSEEVVAGELVQGLPTRQQRLEELGRDLVNAAYLRGDFVLSSGLRSSFFFDKYLFETKPGILRRLGSFLAELLPTGTERIAAPELGGVAIGTAVSLETGLPFVIVKKQAREYAVQRAVEGELYARERVAIIEDILTTGAAALRATSQVKATDAHVVKIIGVLDREEGAIQRIAAAGIECETLFRRSELGV